LLSFVFKTAFEAVPEVREWQVVQEERNRLRMRVELQPGASLDATKVSQAVSHHLAAAGLADDVRFEVVFIPRLEPDPVTGKLRRIVSRVGPPSDLERAMGGGVPVHA
jgi:hypothetical protein